VTTRTKTKPRVIPTDTDVIDVQTEEDIEETRVIAEAKKLMRLDIEYHHAGVAAALYLLANHEVLQGEPDPVVLAHAEARDFRALERHMKTRWKLPLAQETWFESLSRMSVQAQQRRRELERGIVDVGE
jgi:hypothetical protein